MWFMSFNMCHRIWQGSVRPACYLNRDKGRHIPNNWRKSESIGYLFMFLVEQRWRHAVFNAISTPPDEKEWTRHWRGKGYWFLWQYFRTSAECQNSNVYRYKNVMWWTHPSSVCLGTKQGVKVKHVNSRTNPIPKNTQEKKSFSCANICTEILDQYSAFPFYH